MKLFNRKLAMLHFGVTATKWACTIGQQLHLTGLSTNVPSSMAQMESGIFMAAVILFNMFAKYQMVRTLSFLRRHYTVGFGFMNHDPRNSNRYFGFHGQWLIANLKDKPTPSTSKKGFCTDGFEDMMPDSDHCYKIETKRDNSGSDAVELWSEAEMNCREQGAQLASLHSEAETAAVLLNWNPKTSDGLWIGLVAYSE